MYFFFPLVLMFIFLLFISVYCLCFYFTNILVMIIVDDEVIHY